MDRLITPLLILAALSALTGCASVRSYKEPTAGPRARVRIIGIEPRMHTYQCDSDEIDPSGFVYYGGKRHDLHMPNPPTVTDNATEYYVVADKPLLVSFHETLMVAPKGYEVRYVGQSCPASTVSFVPKSGHDYEIRQHGNGTCSGVAAELVSTAPGSVEYVPVAPAPCKISMSFIDGFGGP